MLIKKDSFLTKNDLIFFTSGTGLTITTLTLSDLNVPKISCFIGGLLITGVFKSVKYNLYKQDKRNNLFSLIRFLKLKINEKMANDVGPLVGTFALLETLTFLFDKYALDIPNWFYPLHLLTSTPMFLSINFANNTTKIKHMQELADFHFKGNVQILDNLDGVMTLHSKIPLGEVNKQVLSIICNSHVNTITQDIYRKSIFFVNHKYGKEDKYIKLPKGSFERLEQILIDMKGKPQHINSYENEVETTHEFYCNLNPKKMIRERLNIEHKLGVKKDTLSVESNNGIYLIKVKKEVDKTYILDEYIDKVKIPGKMQLPFILGANCSSGTIVIKDLMDILHLLIVGKTKGGKSVTFKCIIESLMRFNQNIAWYMIDMAESALIRYEDFNNVKFVESDPTSVLSCMNEIIEEQFRRMKLFRNENVENIKEYNEIYKYQPEYQLPYIILCIDEANGFKEEWSKKEFEPMEQKMKTLLKRGRKYGLLTIQAVQQANDTDYVKSWRTQMTRISHRLEDLCDCNNLTTNKEIAQLIPTLQTGEFYLIQGSNIEKMKGCLTDREYNKLYNILRGAYCDDFKRKTINLDKEEEKSQEQSTTAATINP